MREANRRFADGRRNVTPQSRLSAATRQRGLRLRLGCAFAWAAPALGRPLRGNAGCARCAFAWAAPALGRPLRGNAGCARCAFAWAAPSLGRPLRGNAGCARCAFAWAAPSLGRPLRGNPGDAAETSPTWRGRGLKRGGGGGSLKPLPPGGGEVWREGAAPQAPCFDPPTRQHPTPALGSQSSHPLPNPSPLKGEGLEPTAAGHNRDIDSPKSQERAMPATGKCRVDGSGEFRWVSWQSRLSAATRQRGLRPLRLRLGCARARCAALHSGLRGGHA